MSESVVRAVEKRDLPAMIELCREHAAYERAEFVEREREAQLAELVLRSDRIRCWVVDTPNGLAGFAVVSLELSTWDAGRYLHLDCLYLREEHRGQRWGRVLMQYAARTALEWGAVNLQWQTPTWNDGAARFYERLGASAREKLRFTLLPSDCAKLAGEDLADR